LSREAGTEITHEELVKLAEADGVVVLDVRPIEEHPAGHIPQLRFLVRSREPVAVHRPTAGRVRNPAHDTTPVRARRRVAARDIRSVATNVRQHRGHCHHLGAYAHPSQQRR